jgi:hypothetical protein
MGGIAAERMEMERVRAKFKVDRIERSLHWDPSKGELQTIQMAPVTTGSDENRQFFAATPVGVINLGTVNADAAAMFELGKSYYVDFTPAE